MQYDDAMLQTLFVHRPEQQSEAFAHVFPAVVHTGVTVPPSRGEPIGAHLLPTQVSVQQTFPATGQAAPIERHWDAPHVPPTQEPLQQSVETPHFSPGLPQTAGDETQPVPRPRCD